MTNIVYRDDYDIEHIVGEARSNLDGTTNLKLDFGAFPVDKLAQDGEVYLLVKTHNIVIDSK